MTLGRLIVQMMVDDRGLNKTLNRSVTRLEGFTSAVGNIGSSLQQSITLPLLGVGYAVGRATGDIDSLIKELEAATGSAAEAEQVLNRLTQAAKLPGINLEGAIKTTAVLRNIGWTAAGAERAVKGIGKAVAASGGGAEEFRNVARQFRQVASLGRLMGEELNVIIENAPAAAGALMKAFGTTSAEAIRDLNLTTEEFFDRLLKGFEGLPTVAGSVKNSFENLGTAIKQAIGLHNPEDLKLFSETIDKVTAAVERAGAAWRALPTDQRHNILKMAVALVALGPGIRLVTALIGVFGTLRIGVQSVGAAFAFMGRNVAAAGGVMAGFRLTAAALTTTLVTGGIATAIVALAAAFVYLKGRAAAAAAATADAVGQFTTQLATMDATAIGATADDLREQLKVAQAVKDNLMANAPAATKAVAGAGGVYDPKLAEHEESLRRINAQYSLLAKKLKLAKEAFAESSKAAADLAKSETDQGKLMNDLLGGRRTGSKDGDTPLEVMKDQADNLKKALGALPEGTKAWQQVLGETVSMLQRAYSLAMAQKDVTGETAAGYLDIVSSLRSALPSLEDAAEEMFKSKFDLGLEIPVAELKLDFIDPTEIKKVWESVRKEEHDNRMATDRSYAALHTVAEEFERMALEVAISREHLKRQFTKQGLKDTGVAAEGSINNFLSQLTPMGVALRMLNVAFDALQPAIDAMLMPLIMLAEVVGKALYPIFKALFPVMVYLVKNASYMAQAFALASGWMLKSIGWVVAGLGKVVKWLTFGMVDQLEKAGKGMQELGDGLLDSADSFGKLREELDGMTFEDALDRATNGLDKLTESVLNAVEGYKIDYRRHQATDGKDMYGGATGPAKPRSSDLAPGNPTDTNGMAPVNVGGITIVTQGDGRETYRNFYNELDNRTRVSGNPQSRAFFNSLPAPV